jgi:cytochrome c-type biogenesis protein CcsB
MRKFFDFIFSMQFAGTLLLVFAAAIGTATFIENDFGTPAAKAIVYDARWFEALLVLTAISLIGSIFKYKMFERKRYVTVTFHFSFVIILIGAAFTRYIGWEGTMMIREGESSNEIISERPYIQVTMAKDGETYSFDDHYLFNEFKKNRFRKTYEAGEEEFRLEFLRLIPNAAEAVVEDPEGVPIITYVVAGQEGRVNALIREGESRTTSGLTLCFNAEPTDTNAIRIVYTPETGLNFSSTLEAKITNMMSGESEALVKDSLYPLNVMQLYDIGGVQLVVRSFYPAGKTRFVSSPHETSGISAIVMSLSYQGMQQEVGIIGGKGMIGRPAVVNISDASFSISYGSRIIHTPFSIYLRDFQLERYPGSQSPSSYASEVTVIDPRKNLEMPYRIYMNNILNYGGFRFFQSSYDQDEMGTILSVNHDGLGTTVTYFGYALMTLGLILSFFSRNGRFRQLARATTQLNKSAAAVLVALLLSPAILANSIPENENPAFDPKNISASHAKDFGKLLVQDRDGRMKPVNTLSSEILRKIYRKDKLEGLNSDQVFLGMLTYPEYWQTIPMIKVTHKELKRTIGITKSYASFADFIDHETGYYKLFDQINAAYAKKPAERNTFDKDVMKVDERVNIFFMAISGDFLTIFPEPGHPENKWHNPSDPYSYFDSTEALFIDNIMPMYYNAVIEAMRSDDWAPADTLLGYLKLFQNRHGESLVPAQAKLKAEILYNNINIFNRLYQLYGLMGLILLIILFAKVLNQNLRLKWVTRILAAIIIAGFIMHTLGLAMRWYISGHAPWSNGYETMIYIAWGTVLSGVIFLRRSKITLATTAILASVTLMVAHMSWMDPEITNLVPVLKSYWLIIHVAIITASYSFLGVGALLGLMNLLLIGLENRKNMLRFKTIIQELTNINEMNLIIGLFLLTIGTFLGGVWANESWGRYWGWDAKETWALVTILIYSFIIHMRLIPGMGGTFGFNFAALIGFSSVLMTYFGVNYYLSGLHSYAAGDPVPIPRFVYYSVAIVLVISLYAYINHLKMKKLN